MSKNRVTMALLSLVVSVCAVPVAKADNTVHFTGSFTVTNPCNGESASGPIDVFIVVSSSETGEGTTRVTVHHSSHASLNGDQGNVYEVSRFAMAQFDTIASRYDVPWTGRFVGKGGAPDFTASGTLRVFVNGQNEPVGSVLLSITTVCS
jgi:type 1 fimbria pilin